MKSFLNKAVADMDPGPVVEVGNAAQAWARTAPASTKDSNKVRLGGESPSFGPVR